MEGSAPRWFSRGDAERRKREVVERGSGSLLLRAFPLIFFIFFLACPVGVALLLVAAGWIADLARGAAKRLASPGQECRGSAEAGGRHGRCCGLFALLAGLCHTATSWLVVVPGRLVRDFYQGLKCPSDRCSTRKFVMKLDFAITCSLT